VIGIKKQVLNSNKPKGSITVHSCCYFRLGDKIVSEAVIRDYQSRYPADWHIVVEMEDCINSLSMRNVVKCDELWTISYDQQRMRRSDFIEFYKNEIKRSGVKKAIIYHSGFLNDDPEIEIKRQCVFLEGEKLKKRSVFPNFNIDPGYIGWAQQHPLLRKIKKKHKFCFHFRNSNSANLRNLSFEHYIRFADMLRNAYDCEIINIGGKEDLHQNYDRHGIIDFARYNLSVGKTAAIMKLCDMFVGGETGTTMLASAIGQYVLAVGYVNRHAYPYTQRHKYSVLHKANNKEPELHICKMFFDKLFQAKQINEAIPILRGVGSVR